MSLARSSWCAAAHSSSSLHSFSSSASTSTRCARCNCSTRRGRPLRRTRAWPTCSTSAKRASLSTSWSRETPSWKLCKNGVRRAMVAKTAEQKWQTLTSGITIARRSSSLVSHLDSKSKRRASKRAQTKLRGRARDTRAQAKGSSRSQLRNKAESTKRSSKPKKRREGGSKCSSGSKTGQSWRHLCWPMSSSLIRIQISTSSPRAT